MSKKLLDVLKSLVGLVEESESTPTTKTVTMCKSVDQENRMALFVVLAPDTVDAHGDTYDADTVWKACNDFNIHCDRANLFHLVMTEKAQIVQSFITPTDLTIEDQAIVKGSWLQWWYFPETEEGETLWKMVKSGEINGVSVGCTGIVEELE